MSFQEAVSVLDNPVWYSLTTHHAHLAIGAGLAKRYPTDIAPFIALANASEAAFADLAQIMAVGEKLTLRGFELPSDPPGWEIHQRKNIVQMIYDAPIPNVDSDEEVLMLTEDDVPDMLQLVDLAKPGPFMLHTIRLGTYLGIRKDGKLVALSGERMYPANFHEISAVCTHPAYRGKGYARLLMIRLMQQQHARGEVPILHVMPENLNAQRVYLDLGFRKRAEIPYAYMSRKVSI